MSGARKDHKTCLDPKKGPKQRPICRARNAPNGPLGNIVTNVIKGVSNELSEKLLTEAGSTEEVQRTITDGNEKIRKYLMTVRKPTLRKVKNHEANMTKVDKGNICLGSMDVCGLYPAIQWNPASKEVAKAIMESKIDITEMDDKELQQYIAVEYSRAEVEFEDISDVVPIKLPGTNIRKIAREGDQSPLFDYSGVREVNKEDRRKLLSLGVKKAVHIVLSNHFYTFGSVIRKQSKGGSIGSELTGEIARLYMLRWDQKFLAKLRRLGISPHVYTRYVDDTFIVVDVIKPGVKYVSGKLI